MVPQQQRPLRSGSEAAACPAPGFYFHLEPGRCLAGAGLWRPDSGTLAQIRMAIAAESGGWADVLRSCPPLEGESLKQPPRGFDPGHPFVENLKRKDFITGVQFTEAQVCGPQFLQDYVDACRRLSPLVRFLRTAMGLPW